MESLPRDFDGEAFDEYIFPQFERVKVSTSDLEPDNLLEQKKQLLSGEIEEPIFTYNENKKYWYDEREIILLDLKLELNSRKDVPNSVRQAYLKVINEKIAKIRMLREVQSLAKDGQTELHLRRFDRYTTFIYGAPETAIFDNVITTYKRKFKAKCEEGNFSDELDIVKSNIEDFLDKCDVGQLENTIPEFDATSTSQQKGEEVVVDANELKRIFQNALEEYGLSEDWQVLIDKTKKRSKITINNSAKKIRIPNSEALSMRIGNKRLTDQKIAGLIKHEIGTHALRYKNGLESRFKLLSLGMRGYIKGEEGLATYREQQETKVDDYNGFSLYFAAGLAKGLDGGGSTNIWRSL